MSHWPPPDPAVVARVRTFVLAGYTGADRVAILLSQEKWPTPADVRYKLKKPQARWNYTTVARIIAQLEFPPDSLPSPSSYTLGALRRILTHFYRRGIREHEEHLQGWIIQCEAQLATLKPGTKPAAQRTNLFDPIT